MSSWSVLSGENPKARFVSELLQRSLRDFEDLADVDLNEDVNLRVSRGPVPVPGRLPGEYPLIYVVTWTADEAAPYPTQNTTDILARGNLGTGGSKFASWACVSSKQVNRLCLDLFGLDLEVPSMEN